MSIPPEDAAGAMAGATARYAGEPQYPDPWTTKNPKESLRDDGRARIICLSPDVCLTPMGSSQVPVPYMISDRCDHPVNYSTTVFHNGRRVLLLRSKTQHVEGDEPGTGGGVKSGVNRGVCEPIDHAEHYRIEGSPVVRHLDRFWMNNRNTIGEAQYIRNKRSYEAPKDDDPLPGSLELIKPGEGTREAGDGPATMSDASPDLPIAGAQYAQAAPNLDPGGISATPKPPGEVIKPDVPQWKGPPAAPKTDPRAGIRRGIWGLSYWLGGQIGEDYRLNKISEMVAKKGVPIDRSNPDEDAALREYDKALRKNPDLTQEEAQDLTQQLYNRIMLAKAKKQQEDEEAEPKPRPQPKPEKNSRSSEEEKKPCLVDTYDNLKDVCGPAGQGQAHHIVPDYTLRYGTRRQGMAGLNRIPSMPTFGGGAAICLEGHAGVEDSEHNEAHLADAEIKRLGVGANPLNTAPIGDIRAKAERAVIAVRPDCAEKIMAEASKAFKGVNPNQLGRTLKTPLPTGATLDALKNGMSRGGAAQ